jgi:TonB family protein
MAMCAAHRASLGALLILGALAVIPQGCTTSAPTTSPANTSAQTPATSAQTSPRGILRRRASPDGSDPAATLAKSLARPSELTPLGPTEPIPLDSPDPRYSAYLEQVRKRITEKWQYPCVKTKQSCEYKEPALELDFGILPDGQLQFVKVVQTSEYPIYDEYAVTAVRLASPFPRVPPEIVDDRKGKGFSVRANFKYFIEKGRR